MSNEKSKELQARDHLENENNALRRENSELKLREEKYINTIKEQDAELEKLRILARTVENHFNENGSSWQVERCIGCGKCDYVLLEDAVTKALAAGNKVISTTK